MNGSNIVADTSLLINFFNGSEPAKKGQQIWISAITEIELLSHPGLTREEEKLINKREKSYAPEFEVVNCQLPTANCLLLTHTRHPIHP